jgi:hypothetical protein
VVSLGGISGVVSLRGLGQGTVEGVAALIKLIEFISSFLALSFLNFLDNVFFNLYSWDRFDCDSILANMLGLSSRNSTRKAATAIGESIVSNTDRCSEVIIQDIWVKSIKTTGT